MKDSDPPPSVKADGSKPDPAANHRRGGPFSIARSSIADTEDRHCPAAAVYAERGEYRDRRGMDVGTCAHHMLHAVATRSEDTTEVEAVEQTTFDLIANGRSFEGGPTEFPRRNDVDRALGLVLDKLDAGIIPARDEVDWMKAELKVGLTRDFEKCDPSLCVCGAALRQHEEASALQVLRRTSARAAVEAAPVATGSCRPLAIWVGTVDLIFVTREVIDDEEVVVVTVRDHKGGNVTGWTEKIQAKGAILIARALCPEADILRAEAVSYFPWGGRELLEIDLRQEADHDRLAEFRRSIEVQARAHAARQGRDPDTLAAPGPGCGAGYNGEPCPFVLKCAPFWREWAKIEPAIGQLAAAPERVEDLPTWATIYTLARAALATSGARIRAGVAEMAGELDGGRYGCVETADGSVVGWKRRGGSKVTPNAPYVLAEQYVELILRLDPGSAAAQAQAMRLEGLLRSPGALGVTTARALMARFDELYSDEEMAALEALVLEDAPSRELATWKRAPREPTSEELQEALKASEIPGRPPTPTGDDPARRVKIDNAPAIKPGLRAMLARAGASHAIWIDAWKTLCGNPIPLADPPREQTAAGCGRRGVIPKAEPPARIYESTEPPACRRCWASGGIDWTDRENPDHADDAE